MRSSGEMIPTILHSFTPWLPNDAPYAFTGQATFLEYRQPLPGHSRCGYACHLSWMWNTNSKITNLQIYHQNTAKQCQTHILPNLHLRISYDQLHHHQLGFLAKRAFPFLRQLTPTVTLHEVVVIEKGSSIKGLTGFLLAQPKKTAENE